MRRMLSVAPVSRGKNKYRSIALYRPKVCNSGAGLWRRKFASGFEVPGSVARVNQRTPDCFNYVRRTVFNLIGLLGRI
jgi:hypothetical protein